MSGGHRFIQPMRCLTAELGMLSGKYISDSSFLVYERIENGIIMFLFCWLIRTRTLLFLNEHESLESNESILGVSKKLKQQSPEGSFAYSNYYLPLVCGSTTNLVFVKTSSS